MVDIAHTKFGPSLYLALQVCAIAGCIAVAVYLLKQLPEDDDIFEGLAFTFMLLGWMAYSVVISLLSRLAFRYLGRRGLLILVTGPVIAFVVSLYVKWSSFGDLMAGFIVFSALLSLPVAGGIFSALRKMTAASIRSVPLPLEGRGWGC